MRMLVIIAHLQFRFINLALLAPSVSVAEQASFTRSNGEPTPSQESVSNIIINPESCCTLQ